MWWKNTLAAASVLGGLVPGGFASGQADRTPPSSPQSATPAADAQAVMTEDPALPGFTIYRPATMPAGGVRLPVVVYGNGGCIFAGNRSEVFLRAVAAHGYVVIAPGPIRTGPEPESAEQAYGQYGVEKLIEAIDWVFAAGSGRQGQFQGRLDQGKLTVMGRSCGGLQAIVAGADPRVKSVVIINSGIIRAGGVRQADGSVSPRSYLPGTDADLAKLHTPILYLVGGPSDSAFANAEHDFGLIGHVPVFNGNMDVGHPGTFQQPGGGAMGKAAIDWLDWQNHANPTAARAFTGADCRLCTDPAWTVKRKGL